jgi:hypothetical protein
VSKYKILIEQLSKYFGLGTNSRGVKSNIKALILFTLSYILAQIKLENQKLPIEFLS